MNEHGSFASSLFDPGPAPLRLYVAFHPSCDAGPPVVDDLYSWFGGHDGAGHRAGTAVPVHPWTSSDPDEPPLLPHQPASAERAVMLLLVDHEFTGRPRWRAWLDALCSCDSLTLSAWAIHPSAYQSKAIGPLQALGTGPIDPIQLRRRVTELLAAMLADTASGTGLPTANLRIFISYARGDSSEAPGEIDRTLRSYLYATPFLDVSDIQGGRAWAPQLRGAIDEGDGLIAVVTDRYSTRQWCRRELQSFRTPRAHDSGSQVWSVRPVMLVDQLEAARSRSMLEVGSAPVMRYDPVDPSAIVDEFFRELLTAFYLRAMAQAAQKSLPDPGEVPTVTIDWIPDIWTVLSLLRVRAAAGESERSVDDRVRVVYPGDGLPRPELDRLTDAFPNVSFVSVEQARTADPSAHRMHDEETRERSATPRPCVIFSVSDPPPNDLIERGTTKQAFADLVLRLGRLVVRRGFDVAYGGLASAGFTAGLLDDGGTISLEPRVANILTWPYSLRLDPRTVAENLGQCRYVTDIELGGELGCADDWDATDAHQLARVARSTRQAVSGGNTLVDIDGEPIGPRVAHVALGGKVADYAGFLPGVLEEAAQSLQHELPLYVIGGFGGAAGLVGMLLRGDRVDDIERALTTPWEQGTAPAALAAERRALLREAIALLTTLGLDGLANGLSPELNEELTRTIDPNRIVALVSKGLAACLGRTGGTTP